MTVLGHDADPIDLIEYHLSNVRRVRDGEVVRDLGESEAGYRAALDHLRGARSVRDGALKLLDEFDRYASTEQDYAGSPFETRVAQFLVTHYQRR